ncbi:MAG: DUF4032 domain-containing protein [Acidimicrobiales bacterium]
MTAPAEAGRGSFRVTAAPDDPALFDLPWSLPLEEWPAERLVRRPRGISRHVVRFVSLGERVYAVKEADYTSVRKEYGLLRELQRRGEPAVEPVGMVEGRRAPGGEALEPALITRHLRFSLPYRRLLGYHLRPDTLVRLLDAMALLLVRLHLAGFYWGDCSLSNTLFRRDASTFAAYLVDAETGELHPSLTDGQRAADVDLARDNFFGEALDLEAAGQLHPSFDPEGIANDVVARYEGLWRELTQPIVIGSGERFKLEQRMRTLNALGFDVAELSVQGEGDGAVYRVQPRVVEAGHHSRRLLRLTGLDVEENQARRLLNDLDAFAASLGRSAEEEQMAAHRWVAEQFEPVVAAIPVPLRGKLEPAQVYHELLEHRWFLSERAGHDVGAEAALQDYLNHVLAAKPDELAVLGASTGQVPEVGA